MYPLQPLSNEEEEEGVMGVAGASVSGGWVDGVFVCV